MYGCERGNAHTHTRTEIEKKIDRLRQTNRQSYEGRKFFLKYGTIAPIKSILPKRTTTNSGKKIESNYMKIPESEH